MQMAQATEQTVEALLSSVCDGLGLNNPCVGMEPGPYEPVHGPDRDLLAAFPAGRAR